MYFAVIILNLRLLIILQVFWSICFATFIYEIGTYTIYTSRRFPIYPHWVEKKAKGQSLRYRANYPLWTRQQRLNTIFIIITLSESLGREGLVDLVSASVFSFWDSSLRLASRAFRSRSFPVFPERKEDHRYHSSAGVFSRQHGTSFFI